jgi:ribosomal protein L37AE/L43A
VPADQAARATGILAAQDAASLGADWEERAEAGLWTCSVCGEAV